MGEPDPRANTFAAMKQNDITPLLIASVPFFGGILAILFSVFLYFRVHAADSGKEGSAQVVISKTIQNGAISFLKTEYIWLGPFVAVMAIFFLVEEAIQDTGSTGWRMVICFFVGAVASAASGWGGMIIATDCNVKTAEAARKVIVDEKKPGEGLDPALRVAFAGGAVMGFIVVGLGITCISVLFFLFSFGFEDYSDWSSIGNESLTYTNLNNCFTYLAGFSFGASAIALFARVAGGIYTKAADVGADLVGKVEAGFPEDSYYNPATVADNVGDNVGDVAGMGADLFESYVGSIVACATLAMESNCDTSTGIEVCSPDLRRVALPFWVAGFGILASILGFWGVRTGAKMEDEGELQHALLMALHTGIYMSGALILGFSALCIYLLYDYDGNSANFKTSTGWKDFACIVIGLACGIATGEATEYFTSYAHSPTRSITNAGVTGPATVVVQGLGIGMLSSVPPVFLLAATVMSTTALSGVYGAALAAVGMLSTLGITLATDAYGPIADNAGGVAEMAHLPEEVRATTDALDALGNTTAATGKGFAVGSAVLTALAFMNAFAEKVKPKVLGDLAYDHCKGTGDSGTSTGIFAGFSAAQCDNVNKYMTYAGFFDLTEPYVLSGLLIGAMLPFLFAALTMLSVGKAAQGIIVEVRRQLHETGKNGKRMLCLAKATMGENYDYGTYNEATKDWEYKGEVGPFYGWDEHGHFNPAALKPEDLEIKPEVDLCIAICTKKSLAEMIIPGTIAIFTPIGVGLLVGAPSLGGLLMGAISSGFLLAVAMNNAGGAWDNAKKWVENEHPVINGTKVVKGTAHHAAVVTGDTVGDPFKDTSGPALNILIKLMSVLSLATGGLYRGDWDENTWWCGVIILVIELVILYVAFCYVWGEDADSLLSNGNGDVPASTEQPQPTSTEQSSQPTSSEQTQPGTGTEQSQPTSSEQPQPGTGVEMETIPEKQV